MPFTQIQVGRILLREDVVIAEDVDDNGIESLDLTGQESVPKYTIDTLQAKRADLVGLKNAFVPVLFGTKSYLDGYYRVRDIAPEIEDWGGGLGVLRWKMQLLRVGTSAEVDIESRLSGAVTRSNAFAATGERTHAPAIGSEAYWSSASGTSLVNRSTTDGTITLYRGLPATVNPRWAALPTVYAAGRVRFLDEFDRERIGTAFKANASAWTLTNGLVRVKPLAAGGVLEVSAWTGGAWRTKNWDIQTGVSPATITPIPYLRVVRNEYQAITLRLMKNLVPGRTTIDLTLRRGSRLLEIYIQNEYGINTKVVLSTGETSAQTSGYLAATANDAAGNRAIAGSAQTFTADVASLGLTKASAATMDVFIGVIAGGSGAVGGDTAANLYSQYLGMPGEMVQGVRR